MSDDSKSYAGTEPVRPGYTLDQQRLDTWMRANVENYEGPLSVRQFRGGQSNPTYLVITPAQKYVLRRKPPGDILRGAHAVEREAKIIGALGLADFPVPYVYGLCTDEAVIGTWFYVMELVEGRVFWDAAFPEVTREERPLYFDAMNDALARLHSIDYQKIGLEDYGKPGNYFARQIARWSKQYLSDDLAGRDVNMDYLVEWLPKNIPLADESTIVHGDLRCDNIIFHPTLPKIAAVLDWELSTLGHPLADFTYHTMMYHMPPHIIAGLRGVDLEALNIPTEADYVAAYCRRVKRQDIPHYNFYLAFNFFRMAAIFHGIKGRYLRGNASSANAKARSESFPELAKLGRDKAAESQS